MCQLIKNSALENILLVLLENCNFFCTFDQFVFFKTELRMFILLRYASAIKAFCI